MKTAGAIILGIVLITGMVQAQEQAQAVGSAPTLAQIREVQQSFGVLFQAMKDGDVATIEEYQSGAMAAEYKTLLEQNAEYPAFLRNFYKGATFSVMKVTTGTNGDLLVDVAMQLSGGSRSVTELHVQRFDGSPAKWKVTGIKREATPSTH